MKIILLQDVKSLGKKGELKEAKDGYAQNFLIAKGLAKKATTENIRKLESDRKKQEQEQQEQLQNFKKIKEIIETKPLSIKHKIGKNGSLYGAITKIEIAQILQDNDIQIDKKQIEIKTPIKMSGTHDIDIKLGQGIHALLQLDITGE